MKLPRRMPPKGRLTPRRGKKRMVEIGRPAVRGSNTKYRTMGRGRGARA